jgi:hypothetical protein
MHRNDRTQPVAEQGMGRRQPYRVAAPGKGHGRLAAA